VSRQELAHRVILLRRAVHRSTGRDGGRGLEAAASACCRRWKSLTDDLR